MTVVYTSIFGMDDYLRDPVFLNDVDFVCFTDNPNLKSDIWDVRYVEPTDEDSCRAAKIYKILPHRYFPNHEVSLWIDSYYELVGDPRNYITHNNMSCFNHRIRKDIYDEAFECIKRGGRFGNPQVIAEQMQRYLREGFSTKLNGFIYGGVLLRRHHKADVIQVMEAWWEEIKNGSRRDQLSFNYAADKYLFEYSVIHGDVYDNNTNNLVNSEVLKE